MSMEKENGVVEIDLKRLMMALGRRAWIILLTGVLAGALAFGYAWFLVAPTYRATTQLYVNNNYAGSTSGVSSSQIAAALNLADTYMVILKSRSVLEEVTRQTGLPYTYEQMRKMVSAAAVNNTEVFEVEVISTNSQHAYQIASKIAEVMPTRIAEVIKGSSVGVVDYAMEDPEPVGPSYFRYTVIGALSGILLCGIFAVMADMTDTSIKSEDYLAQIYGDLPLLAVIPGAQSNKKGYYKGYYASPQKRPTTGKSGGAK